MSGKQNLFSVSKTGMTSNQASSSNSNMGLHTNVEIKCEKDVDVTPPIVPILPSSGDKIVKSVKALDPKKLRMLGLDTKIFNAVSRRDG